MFVCFLNVVLREAGVKVLAALIANKVPAFGTAGCTSDDVFALRDGARSGNGRDQTEIETPEHVLCSTK